MKKEPIGLYIFRFIVGFGILCFMGMLYWSSTLIEDNIVAIRSDISQLKSDFSSARAEINTTKEEVKELKERGISQSASVAPNTSLSKKLVHPFMDPKFPNLLEEDPFYTATLQKMLGKNFSPHGKFQSATIGKPENLHPFSNWAQVATWIAQCTVSLSRLQFGKYETFSPDMAIKIEARPRLDGTPEFWVFLRDNVYWHPLREELFENKIHLAPHFSQKHQVTAEDFKFFFDAMMNPYVGESGAVALRNYLGDIEEIEVKDKLTFVVRWSAHPMKDGQGTPTYKIKYMARAMTGELRPLPIFVYQYFPDGTKIIEDDQAPNTYRTNSVWAQNYARHWANNVIVSCGPWIFDGMTDRQIKFKRNQDHYFPYDVLAESSAVDFKNTTEAIWQDFKANLLDSYGLQPDQLMEWEGFKASEIYQQQAQLDSAIKRLDYPARAYLYIGWNQATPYFNSKKVRVAMTMAIDRARIIKQNLNSMGIEISGPFSPASSENDPSISPLPYDANTATRLLEEEGWYDSDGDGVLDKVIEGKVVPFRFSLTYYVRNPTTKAICEYVATALKEIGVSCSLNGVDIADLSAAFDGKSFDALCLAWVLGTPPSDPRQLWYSAGAKEPGSSNAVGFANAEADEIIDKLSFENDPEKRTALYHRFHAIIHDEQPYTFLYEPKIAFLYRERLQNVFIPAERQELIPGANVAEPISSAFWLKEK
ncbi:MAG TPA: ABC transporter substrate-binding protein [Waddliaceae bacterium]